MHATSQNRRTAAQRRVDDPQGPSRRRSRLIGAALIVGTLAIAISLVATGSVPLGSKSLSAAPAAAQSDITVNFGDTVAADDPAAIGVDESTYGMPSDINDPQGQALLKKLGVGYSRLWLTLSDPANPASRITCAAAGCDTSLDVDTWIRMMETVGEVPVIGIPDTLSPADAAAIVSHFAASHAIPQPVMTWVIGNEPESVGENAETYDARFNALFDAMKKADPAVAIGGPGTLNFDQAFLQQFLQQCGSRADFVDFHFYPGHETAAQLIAGLPALSADLTTLRAMIKATVPDRASEIAIHIGEWNFSADPGTLARYAFTGFASVLDADILGRILTSGADSLAWGSQNGPMSLIYGDVFAAGGGNPPKAYKQNSPMPLYEAIGMFTGQGLFPRFGTKIVSATSILRGVDAFASASPDEIVIVNTNAKAEKATVAVHSGNPQAAVIWQLHQTGPVTVGPVRKGTATSEAGHFTVSLPGDSVTTLVLTTLVSHQK